MKLINPHELTHTTHSLMKPKIIGGSLLVACIMLTGATLLEAAPDTITQSVSYGGETITMQLTKENLRGSHFEVLVQNSSGTYDTYTAVDERSYIGTVDEYPGAVACGIQMDNGTFKGAVYFDRGATWYTQGSWVTGTRASLYNNFTDFEYPTASSVTAGQAGSTTYGYDVGIDAEYGYYSGAGGSSIAKTFELIEYSVCLSRAMYMRDVMLRPYLGRIIIRSDQTQDPYTGLQGGTYLVALKDHWNANHSSANSDLVAGVCPSKVGGGLAYIGAVGENNRYSVNDGGSNGHFDVVWRHEMGHNWGCSHYVGGSPEGTGIMGGNKPTRFSGCEVNTVFSHRDSRISAGGILDNEGTFTGVNLPPYAALDAVAVEIETGKVEMITVDLLANDFDANGHSFTLDSYDTTSNLGYPVTVSVGTGANGQDELVYSALGGSGLDYFSYTIKDSTGQTAKGYVLVNSKGVTPKIWEVAANADTFVKVNSSTNFGSVDNLYLKNQGSSSSYTRTGWVHFDVSGKTYYETASLKFTVDIASESVGNIDVWGVVDGANGDHFGTDWTESGLVYGNAPAKPDYNEGAQLTYLGSFNPSSVGTGSTCEFSSAALLSFLQADTNGEVTFLLQREQGQGSEFSLRTKEHASGGGPTLSTSFPSGQYLGTDSYVRDGGYAGDNYGSEPEMVVKNDASGFQRESYLRFNHISSSNFGAAKTLLTLTALQVQSGQTYRIRLVDDSGDGWEEAGLNYNNRPVGSGAGITFNADDMTEGTPYTIDISGLFSQVGNANGAATLHIDALSQITTGFNRFATRENAIASYRPSIQIIDADPHDTYVRGGIYADDNYGSDTDLVLKNADPSYYREFFLRCAYQYNGGKPVAAAALTLTPVGISGTCDIRVRLLDDADDGWKEGELTYNNRPSASGSEVVFSSGLMTVNQPYSIDVTSLLNQSMNVNRVASFLVDLPGSTGPAYFTMASKEEANVAYRPVLNVNPNAPVALNANVNLASGSSVGTVVTTVSAVDQDASDTLSYAITSGNAGGLFAINPSTGVITTAASVAEGQYVLTVSVTDSGVPALGDTALITVDVTAPANTAPVAGDTSGSVSEGAAIGTSVATVTSSDADAGDTASYSITSGNTGGAFAINSGTGEITTATALDYETVASYSLTVTVTDSGGLTDTAYITVNVVDVANDDSDGDSLTDEWELSHFGSVAAVDGTSDSDGDGLTDFEEFMSGTNPNSLDSDGDGYSDKVEAFYGADPNDSQDVPVLSPLMAYWSFDDGSGSIVEDASGWLNDGMLGGGTVWTTAAVEGGGVSFDGVDGKVTTKMPESNLGAFTVAFWVKNGNVSQGSYAAVFSNYTSNVGNTFQIDMGNGFQYRGAQIVSFGSAPANTWVHLAVVSDGTDTTLYYNGVPVTVLTGVNDDLFNSLNLGVNRSENSFFQGIVDEFYLYRRDLSQQEIQDLMYNDSPVASDASFSVSENVSAGTSVGTVSATDPENDALTYVITAGNGGGEFAINGSTGEITTTTALDYETVNQYMLTVEVSDGELTDTAVINIDVSNVNEAPVTNDVTSTLPEDVPVGTSVVTVPSSDVDANDSFSFAIIAGNDGTFAIDSATGEIITSGELDYETTSFYSLTVEVTDAGGLSDQAIVEIQVIDVAEWSEYLVAGGNLSDPNNWSMSAPDADTAGYVTVDALIDSMISNYDLILKAGTITRAEDVIYEWQGDTDVVIDGAILDYTAGSASGNTHRVLRLMGTSSLVMQSGEFHLWSDRNVEFFDEGTIVVHDGVVYAGGLLNKSSSVGPVLTFDIGNGVVNLTNGKINLTNLNYIDFLTGTEGKLTVAGADSAYFESKWNSGEIKCEGTNNGTFSSLFKVTGDTLELRAIPLPVVEDISASVYEDALVGTVVAQATALYSTGTENWLLIDDAGGLFTINSATGEISTAAVLDYESASSYVLTVSMTDDAATAVSALVLIDIINVNEAPVVSDVSVSVPEDTAVGTVIASLISIDPDSGDAPAYSITSGNDGSFVINSNTGEITTSAALDYETTTGYLLTIAVTDGGGLTDTALVDISISNVADVVTSYTSDAEYTVEGAILSGSYASLQVSDNVYEALQENTTSGNPSTRVSSLEHTWSFEIGAGGSQVELSVEAYHSSNSEGDHFVFGYSTDGINFTDVITVTKTVDDDAVQVATLPAGISGTVYIRVLDTDRTPGNRVQDNLYIDYLSLEVTN